MEASVIQLNERQKKILKPKVQPIQPTNIVDVWRLVWDQIRENVYPDVSEESPDVVRSHLFVYLQNPMFVGLIARVGKKPIGAILGHVAIRPYGRPQRAVVVTEFAIDPKHRRTGVGKMLWDDLAEKLKKAGVFYWECAAKESVLKEEGIAFAPIMSVHGGKF